MRKNIIALFKNEGLSINIETNLFESDFLDVALNMVIRKCFLFRKPNSQPLYINQKSNHPPTIIKDIPNTINKRLSDYLAMKKSMKKQNLCMKLH